MHGANFQNDSCQISNYQCSLHSSTFAEWLRNNETKINRTSFQYHGRQICRLHQCYIEMLKYPAAEKVLLLFKSQLKHAWLFELDTSCMYYTDNYVSKSPITINKNIPSWSDLKFITTITCLFSVFIEWIMQLTDCQSQVIVKRFGEKYCTWR